MLILVSVLFILHKSCGVDEADLDNVSRDTVYVPSPPDTLILHDTISFTVVKPKPYAVYIDTNEAVPSVVSCDSMRDYSNEFNNDKGTVKVFSKVKGEIVEQQVECSLRELIISQMDTVFIVTPPETCEDLNTKKPIFSLGAGFTNNITPFVYGSMYYRGKSVITGYNFVDHQVSMGVGFVISKKK